MQSVREISKELRREDRSIRNRLQSILHDNTFLSNAVMEVFSYGVVPNERCGLWYCKDGEFSTTSYFKSTDGHVNQWDFSLRRLNFHLLKILGEDGGVIIVDSTRRGKRIPDALSKTVPIWCAVLNYLILEEEGQSWPFDREILFVPPGTVPDSERERISQKIPELVENLKKLRIMDGSKLKELLGKGCEGRPRLLRPIWIYPGSSLLRTNVDLFTGEKVMTSKWTAPEDIIPLILCTVSYQCQDGVDKRNGFTYVQGAADDHELWSNGLTPALFWKHIRTLGDPEKSDSELLKFIDGITSAESLSGDSSSLEKILASDIITPNLHLGIIQNGVSLTEQIRKELKKRYSRAIICSESVKPDGGESSDMLSVYPLSSGSKKSSRDLRAQLITIDKMIATNLNRELPILIACNTGADISVCILLVALCKYYNVEWELEIQNSINKTIIRKHLAKIIDKLQGRNVNPARASLNSVNSFLM